MTSRFVPGYRAVAIACLAAALLLPGSAPAQTFAVKIGTIAPEGSPWHEILLDMGQKWRTASGGKVTIRIYAGTQGDEPEMIRKMRIGQLHAAAVTSVGLDTITPEMSALSIPLLFNTYDEVDYVRDRISPRLTKALEDKGFYALNFGDAGWIRFFTKRPATNIDELRAMKLFTWAGTPATEEMYKDAGFRPVPLAPTDILSALQTGLIEAFPAPAAGALSYQWFGLAKNMTDIKFAPIVGATIITKDAWDRIAKIDPALPAVLMKEAQAAGERLKDTIRKLDDEAIDAMVKRGLTVVKVSPEAEREWRQSAEKFYGRIRGEFIQPADFDEVMALVKEYRARKSTGSAAIR
jgi:TRAP-type transport system periplasmic protein